MRGRDLLRTLYEDTHEIFRKSFRTFAEKEIVPFHDEWERAGIVDKAMFRKAGQAGFLGIDAPAEYGGGGVSDYRFSAVMLEELARLGVSVGGACLGLHNDMALPYLFTQANDEQKARWLPGVCSGNSCSPSP